MKANDKVESLCRSCAECMKFTVGNQSGDTENNAVCLVLGSPLTHVLVNHALGQRDEEYMRVTSCSKYRQARRELFVIEETKE